MVDWSAFNVSLIKISDKWYCQKKLTSNIPCYILDILASFKVEQDMCPSTSSYGLILILFLLCIVKCFSFSIGQSVADIGFILLLWGFLVFFFLYCACVYMCKLNCDTKNKINYYYYYYIRLLFKNSFCGWKCRHKKNHTA